MAFPFFHLFILQKAVHIAQNYMFYLKRNFRAFTVASKREKTCKQVCLRPVNPGAWNRLQGLRLHLFRTGTIDAFSPEPVPQAESVQLSWPTGARSPGQCHPVAHGCMQPWAVGGATALQTPKHWRA